VVVVVARGAGEVVGVKIGGNVVAGAWVVGGVVEVVVGCGPFDVVKRTNCPRAS
jgi:hypothetical protein